ncbi:zinc/manganese transport system ATP-binding protein [Franzmannia pantelleriensis]|uniref:Zinc/manganese transport system ATP-binding protein n=1 Tax=Franzmannia pantelleriensis TaxID=48727 RepID=A0A1G9X4U8_9GAMM|nr:ABC transporter ATP-binding protein [Halomonas pantelleriensis]SDM91738.1 zinc/manganese transport system ATP-binding protein [Halomonas pantelleriensis]
MSRLRLNDLQLAQGGRTVLEHVSGNFEDSAITALIGANGAGKSTLIQAIMGELAPIHGRIECDVPKERRAWLPQQLALDLTFPMSVEELIMTGTWPSHGAFKGYCGPHYRQAREVMSRLGITDLAHRPLGELSGGQRQRALLGRTLMQEAELLLLDEPFANVDVETVEVLMGVLRDMAAQGATIIVVLHDLEQLSRLADCVLALAGGHARWSTPEAIVERHQGGTQRHHHAPILPLDMPGLSP